jgi:hypothetical protein
MAFLRSATMLHGELFVMTFLALLMLTWFAGSSDSGLLVPGLELVVSLMVLAKSGWIMSGVVELKIVSLTVPTRLLVSTTATTMKMLALLV